VTFSELERRFTAGSVELRETGSGGRPRIGGYAAVFNKPSGDLGGFIEEVAPSAFNMSRGVGWSGVIARYNHDDNMLLGTVHGGTLELEIDRVGLGYVVEPPPTRADIVDLVRRGDVHQSSFAFRVPSDGDDWGLTEDGYPLRTLRTVQLVDVAPVNMPAYSDSTVGLRSLAERKGVPLAEVRKLAAGHELRRLFRRTDVLSRPKTPAAAKRHLLARRYDPTDVRTGVPRRPTTPADALRYLETRRYDPIVPNYAERHLLTRRYDPDDR